MTQPFIKLLLVGCSAVAPVSAQIKTSPTSHNFGKVTVMGADAQRSRTTMDQGSWRGTRLQYTIDGPNKEDFAYYGPVDPFDVNHPCDRSSGEVVCMGSVMFKPQGTGPRRATLHVENNAGWGPTVVQLEGTGVLPVCTHSVIPCNYAIHYSGVFSWQGAGEQVNVDVLRGVASCNGTVPDGGRIQGPGLIGVEFGPDEVHPSFYRITVACPSPAFPSRDGYPATPSEPAELGRGEQSSDKQPLMKTLQQIQERLPSLKHSITIPGAEVASGTLTISWDLCPNALTIPTVGGQARCSP